MRRVVPTPLLLLVAILTTLALNTSPAAASGGPETRVRAIPTATAAGVGQPSSETAGHVGQLRPPQSAIASGSCVATNTAGVRTIADETGQVTSYDSFGQAKSAVGTNPGEDIHHFVEQCQCNASRSGFTPQQVNSTDNLVRLPESVHDEISAFYSSRPPGFSTTVRNSLNGLPWQEQYDFGMDVVQRALNGEKLR